MPPLDNPDSTPTRQFSPRELEEIERFKQSLLQKKANVAQDSRRCVGCRLFMGGRVARDGEELVCETCQKRRETCALCALEENEGEEVCDQCVKAGARVCDHCLRPAAKNGAFCAVCERAQKRMTAGHFAENEALPTPNADLRGGYHYEPPSPGAQWQGPAPSIPGVA